MIPAFDSADNRALEHACADASLRDTVRAARSTRLTTMQTTTRAILVRRHGGPEVLEPAEIPLAPPGPGEVRVRNEAIGLNFVDVYFRTGLYAPRSMPFVPGAEGAGVVEALGDGARGLAVGDRVAYATRPLGAYSERRNMPAERVVLLPDRIASDVAAASMLKGMTAHMLLRRVVSIGRGHAILFHAAAGGVGSFLVPWAKRLGARVIGTAGSDAKAARAKASGCDDVIVYTREDFVARTKELTNGAGVDVAYDSVGRDTFLGSLECLKTRGMLVSFGQSSGPIAPFDVGLLAKRSLTLTRCSLFDYTGERTELVAAASELFAMLEAGVVHGDVERRYPLADAASAHRDLEARKTVGSTVLVP